MPTFQLEHEVLVHVREPHSVLTNGIQNLAFLEELIALSLPSLSSLNPFFKQHWCWLASLQANPCSHTQYASLQGNIKESFLLVNKSIQTLHWRILIGKWANKLHHCDNEDCSYETQMFSYITESRPTSAGDSARVHSGSLHFFLCIQLSVPLMIWALCFENEPFPLELTWLLVLDIERLNGLLCQLKEIILCQKNCLLYTSFQSGLCSGSKHVPLSHHQNLEALYHTPDQPQAVLKEMRNFLQVSWHVQYSAHKQICMQMHVAISFV